MNVYALQGSVLSAFFWGYATTPVLGGYLSDRFGAKVVMISAMIGWSALTLITPLMTRACCDESRATVLHMFVILRVLTGCVQGRSRFCLPPAKEDVNAFARICLSVCLSVSKITQKRMHGFG